jgi:hypothetical protein
MKLKNKEDKMSNEERLTEDQWLQKMLTELHEDHGIDTSEWEYKYGDGCYTAAEFLARCISNYKAE